MRLGSSFLAVIGAILFCGFACFGATVTGGVKGPDGAPFRGAFVEARNAKTKITYIALSNSQGMYRIDKLPAGTYRIQIRAIGYRFEPQDGVNLDADQTKAVEVALQPGTVHWNDISIYQAKQLFPAAKGKDLLFAHCEICHAFQSRMASVPRDADGWKDRVAYMRTAMHYSIFLEHLTDGDADDIASYLTSLFGPDSILPKSPADLPGYKDTVRPFTNDAMNIVYVEYDMPGPSRMPFSAAPDKNGYLWIPDFGVANKITRLDPKTGEMQDFPVPNVGTAGIHSAVPAPDGSVWLTEQGSNKLGRWDPTTQKITEYQDKWLPGLEGIEDGGSKHTLRIDRAGKVWSSGGPFTMFDPETGKFTRFEGIETYDVKPDRATGDVWFTSPGTNKIGKVDSNTMKLTEWTSPTPGSAPRRLEIGPDGMIYFGEFRGGKMGQFDPKTQTFKEFPLPGPDPTPYGLGFDTEGYLWYDSHEMDLIGRFDPRTGKVIEYPFPHPELCMREFFRDSEGHMWYGTPPNNKVGYFYLSAPAGGAKSAGQ